MRKKKGWDIVKKNREAKRIMEEKWEINKIGSTDAKEFILPELKKWLQDNSFTQFSDLSLAESIISSEIDPEIKDFIYKLATFTDVVIK